MFKSSKQCEHCGMQKHRADRRFCSKECHIKAKRKSFYDDEKRIKRCSRCNEWKSFSSFAARRSGEEKLKLPLLQPHCKDCSKYIDKSFKANNCDHLREYKKNRYWENPEKARASRRDLPEAERLAKNKRQREYAKANKDKVLMFNRIRRHKERAAGALPHRFDIGYLLCMQDARCIYCNEIMDKYHIDHKIPVSKGGTNELHNLQLLCPTCNMKKSVLTHEEYVHRKFGMNIEEFNLMRKNEYEQRNLVACE